MAFVILQNQLRYITGGWDKKLINKMLKEWAFFCYIFLIKGNESIIKVKISAGGR